MGSSNSNTIELRLPSQLRFLSVVDAVVQSFASEFDLDPEEINGIGTAAIEAASNAVEHANKFDENKTILLRLTGRDNVVEVDVEDEGSGFDPKPYERELETEDLMKLRGRGIYIMRSFMDDVRFTKLPGGGTRVRLRKVGKGKKDRSAANDPAQSN